MIRLITGNPGSGKTLLVVSDLVQAAKLANRPIYTNVTGLAIPGVQVLPDHADWTLLPDRSLVVFDECQDIEIPLDGLPSKSDDAETNRPMWKPYAATGTPGLAKDRRLAQLRQHRKREFDLWFISQHPSFIHHDVRKIADEHVHMLRVMGLSRSTKYTFTGSYCASPEKPEERRRGDKEFWRHPRKFFGAYHSANGHHFKFKMPRKLAMVGIAVICTALLGVWFLLGRAGLGDSPAYAAEVSEVTSPGVAPGQTPAVPSGEFAWTDTPRVTPIAGCAVLTNSCRCWDTAGLQLALSEGECLTVASRPLPLSFVASASSTAPGGVGGSPPTVSPVISPTPEAGGGGGPLGASGARHQVGPPGDKMGHVW